MTWPTVMLVPVVAGMFIRGRRSLAVVAALGLAIASLFALLAGLEDADDPGWVVALFVFVTAYYAFGALIGFAIRSVATLIRTRPALPGTEQATVEIGA